MKTIHEKLEDLITKQKTVIDLMSITHGNISDESVDEVIDEFDDFIDLLTSQDEKVSKWKYNLAESNNKMLLAYAGY